MLGALLPQAVGVPQDQSVENMLVLNRAFATSVHRFPPLDRGLFRRFQVDAFSLIFDLLQGVMILLIIDFSGTVCS